MQTGVRGEMRIFKSALQAAAVSILILAAIALMAQTRSSLATGSVRKRALLQGISVHTSPDGIVTINVGLNRTVGYRIFRLSSPDRVVLDLEGAHKAVSKRDYPAQSPLLERVRVGQWRSDPAIARVVADLKGATVYTVKRQGSSFRIELKPQNSANRPAYGFHKSQPQSAQNSREVRGQSFAAESASKSPFTVHRFKDLSASLTGPELPSQDRLVPVTRPDQPDSGNDSASLAVVSGISIKPDVNGRTFVDIASSRSVPYRVFQLADPFRLVIDLKDAHNGSSRDVYPVDSSVLKRIRVAQWRPGDPPVVRVVADLEGYPVFDVHAAQPGIRVELKPRQELGPLLRNPFEFAVPQHAARQPNQAMTAAAGSPAAGPGNSFAQLKVIGFIQQNDASVQAVISDRSSIYFVPNGGTFENTYRVIAISPNAVQIQNIETLDTSWLTYIP